MSTSFLVNYINSYNNIVIAAPEEVAAVPPSSSVVVVPNNSAVQSTAQPTSVESLLGFSESGENIYVGEQQIISADRLILNAKRNYCFLFAKRGIGLSANQAINLESGNDIILYPYGRLLIGVPSQVNSQTTEQQNTGAPADQSYEPIPLGNKLTTLLEDLITSIMQLKITTPIGEGLVTSDSQYNLQKIYARVSEIKSTIAFIDGTKHDSIPGPLPSFPTETNTTNQASITYATVDLQSSSLSSSGDFVSPVQGGRITSVPGNRINPITGLPQNHGGLDVANVPGTPIYAIADGEVIKTNDGCLVGDKTCGGRLGNYVIIKHVGGIEAKYGHMQTNSVAVHQGDRVTKGQLIGLMGNTGASSGTHLHIQTKALPGSSYSDKIMADGAAPNLINPLDLFKIT